MRSEKYAIYPYVRPNRRNSRVLREIVVEEDGGTWRQILDWKSNYSCFAHVQWKMCNITLIYGPIEEIFASREKSDRGTRRWRQILDRKWNYGRFAHAQWKIRNITLICGRIAENFTSYKKSRSKNSMMTSVLPGNGNMAVSRMRNEKYAI